MHLLRFTFLLAFVLLAAAPAFAQPKGFITGTYKVTLTLDGTAYQLDVAAYQISTIVVAGDSVVLLETWSNAAAVQRAGLPSSQTLKGKQSSMTRLFKEITPGRFQTLTLDNVSIAGLKGGVSSPLMLQLNLGTVAAAREAGSGMATGLLLPLEFKGPLIQLNRN